MFQLNETNWLQVGHQEPDHRGWNHLPGMAETLLGTNISAGYVRQPRSG